MLARRAERKHNEVVQWMESGVVAQDGRAQYFGIVSMSNIKLVITDLKWKDHGCTAYDPLGSSILVIVSARNENGLLGVGSSVCKMTVCNPYWSLSTTGFAVLPHKFPKKRSASYGLPDVEFLI